MSRLGHFRHVAAVQIVSGGGMESSATVAMWIGELSMAGACMAGKASLTQ